MKDAPTTLPEIADQELRRLVAAAREQLAQGTMTLQPDLAARLDEQYATGDRTSTWLMSRAVPSARRGRGRWLVRAVASSTAAKLAFGMSVAMAGTGGLVASGNAPAPVERAVHSVVRSIGLAPAPVRPATVTPATPADAPRAAVSPADATTGLAPLATTDGTVPVGGCTAATQAVTHQALAGALGPLARTAPEPLAFGTIVDASAATGDPSAAGSAAPVTQPACGPPAPTGGEASGAPVGDGSGAGGAGDEVEPAVVVDPPTNDGQAGGEDATTAQPSPTSTEPSATPVAAGAGGGG